MVDIKDVRDYLRKMPEARVHDDTVEKMIEQANTLVESEKGTVGIPFQVMEEAKLAWAGYFTFLAYGIEVERASGGLPAQVSQILAELKAIAETFLKFVKRGGGARGKGAVRRIQLTESVTTLLEELYY